MTNRRGAIIAFALAAVMLVGIGFAAVVTEINLTGYIAFSGVNNEFDKDIQLVQGTGITSISMYEEDNTKIEGLAGDVLSASVDASDPDVGSITAKNFSKVGQYVIAQYKVVNHGKTKQAATLSIDVDTATSTADNNYFSVTKKFAADDEGKPAAELTDTYELDPNEYCWVIITLKCDKVSTDTATDSGKIEWKINATSKDPAATP